MPSNLIGMASYLFNGDGLQPLLAMDSYLFKSDGIQPTSDNGLQSIAMASNGKAMASNLLAMASSQIATVPAMASKT